jgi:hypothetical protein
MSYKTYKGARLDLEIYQGKSTIDYEIEVFTDDGAEYDFTIYSSLVAKIFYRKHGEEIVTLTVSNSDNVLLLDALKAQTAALQTREYWLEIYGILITPVSEQDLIVYGIIKNV